MTKVAKSIATIIRDSGQGFFLAKRPGDAVELFVHRYDVIEGLDRLRVGATVEFDVKPSEKRGRRPVATRVRVR